MNRYFHSIDTTVDEHVIVRLRERGNPDNVIEWEIDPFLAAELAGYLARHASRSAKAIAVRIAVGDCETCGNTGLVTEDRNGRPWSVRCPDCGERRHALSSGDLPYPKIGGTR